MRVERSWRSGRVRVRSGQQRTGVRHVALALSLCGPTLTGKRGGWHSLELISFALTGRTFGADTKRFVSDFPWRER